MEPLRAYDRALFGGSPQEVPDAYRDSSPLTYCRAVRAPVLVLAGENDPRCPIRQIDNYLDALAARWPPVRGLPVRRRPRLDGGRRADAPGGVRDRLRPAGPGRPGVRALRRALVVLVLTGCGTPWDPRRAGPVRQRLCRLRCRPRRQLCRRRDDDGCGATASTGAGEYSHGGFADDSAPGTGAPRRATQRPVTRHPRTAGPLPTAVGEASGVAASSVDPDLYFVVDDGTGAGALAAVRGDGSPVGTVVVEGMAAGNAEAVSAGPCPAGRCLFVGDIGGNRGRETVTVYRLTEPALPLPSSVSAERWDYAYPDGSYDAEAMLVTDDGGIVVVTKPDGGTTPHRVYAGPAGGRRADAAPTFRPPTPARAASPRWSATWSRTPPAGRPGTAADLRPGGGVPRTDRRGGSGGLPRLGPPRARDTGAVAVRRGRVPVRRVRVRGGVGGSPSAAPTIAGVGCERPTASAAAADRLAKDFRRDQT